MPDKQVAVISAQAEGSGIRQIERMTGVNRNTIMMRPVISPLLAVRAAIVEEFRRREAEEA